MSELQQHKALTRNQCEPHRLICFDCEVDCQEGTGVVCTSEDNQSRIVSFFRLLVQSIDSVYFCSSYSSLKFRFYFIFFSRVRFVSCICLGFFIYFLLANSSVFSFAHLVNSFDFSVLCICLLLVSQLIFLSFHMH